jgi:hypothetical protein
MFFLIFGAIVTLLPVTLFWTTSTRHPALQHNNNNNNNNIQLSLADQNNILSSDQNYNYGVTTTTARRISEGKLWSVTTGTDNNDSNNNDSNNNNNPHDIPDWMAEYFDWHVAERKRLLLQEKKKNKKDDWKSSHKFIVLQCLPASRKCGGTADRLKPLPLFLLLAHRTKRLLLIKWGRPAELEEFLLPPRGGIDWRVPDWLYDIPEFRAGPRATNVEELVELMENPEFTTVKARVQAHDHGAAYYDDHHEQQQRKDLSQPSFQQVYHACWRVMFTPAPPVARLIQEQLQQSGLQPGKYVGIHIRALYAVEERDPGMVRHWSRNSVNCASQLQQGGPFYIASDSEFAVQVAQEYGREKQVVVASRSIRNDDGTISSSHAQPYHLDKAPRKAKASDFYDTFVDLYLLALSRCITYNMGGFGTWALYISPHANDRQQNPVGACSMQHHEAAGIHKCDWAGHAPAAAGGVVDNDIHVLQVGNDAFATNGQLFIPPMTTPGETT